MTHCGPTQVSPSFWATETFPGIENIHIWRCREAKSFNVHGGTVAKSNCVYPSKVLSTKLLGEILGLSRLLCAIRRLRAIVLRVLGRGVVVARVLRHVRLRATILGVVAVVTMSLFLAVVRQRQRALLAQRKVVFRDVNRLLGLGDLDGKGFEIVEGSFHQRIVALEVSQQLRPQWLFGQHFGVSQHHQSVFGARQRHVEAARIVQETNALWRHKKKRNEQG